MADKVYEVREGFRVSDDHDHLRDEGAIRSEVESWLQSLDADVLHVQVREDAPVPRVDA